MTRPADPDPTPTAATPAPAAPAPPSRPLLEIVVTIIVPAVVLMQLTESLGTLPTLLLALAFPLGWGLWQVSQRRRFGLMAAIGVVSTLLTGGIGLLELDAQWLAVKEAAVSGVIGLVVGASAWTRNPLIHALVFNATLFDVERIQRELAARGTAAMFDDRLRQGTLMLAGTFFFSSAMNYALTRWIVSSPAGTPAFNEELGRLTLVSYAAIGLPSMAMMMAIMYWLARSAKAMTGLELDEMLQGGAAPRK